jgi:hypothetical protein
MESFHWSPAQGSAIMHFAISATSGPTGPTRPMLPFIFAASDSVTLMLFHDAVYMAVKGAAAKLVRVVPPNRVGSARDQFLGRGPVGPVSTQGACGCAPSRACQARRNERVPCHRERGTRRLLPIQG